MLSRRLRFGDGAGNLFRNGTYRLLMRDLERGKACAWQERAWAGALRAYLGHRTSQTVLYSLWRASTTVMKQFLLFTFMAVASEAMAQGAQCVPERAAMVDTIRACARSEALVLGLQGISERVLEAMGQTERHRFIPERSCSVAYMDAPVLIWPRPDNIAAVYSRTDDPSRSAQVR